MSILGIRTETPLTTTKFQVGQLVGTFSGQIWVIEEVYTLDFAYLKVRRFGVGYLHVADRLAEHFHVATEEEIARVIADRITNA